MEEKADRQIEIPDGVDFLHIAEVADWIKCFKTIMTIYQCGEFEGYNTPRWSWYEAQAFNPHWA